MASHCRTDYTSRAGLSSQLVQFVRDYLNVVVSAVVPGAVGHTRGTTLAGSFHATDVPLEFADSLGNPAIDDLRAVRAFEPNCGFAGRLCFPALHQFGE